MKTCQYQECKKEFEPKNPKGRYCSDKCRVYASRKKPKENETDRTFLTPGSSVTDLDSGQKIENNTPAVVEITDQLNDFERKQLEDRRNVLKAEIKNPPKNLQLGVKMYLSIREKELKEIEAKLAGQ